jgi:hypothetical protein
MKDTCPIYKTLRQSGEYPNSSALLVKCLLDALIGRAGKYPFLVQDLTQIADELEGAIK